jgi:hypothetical protein
LKELQTSSYCFVSFSTFPPLPGINCRRRPILFFVLLLYVQKLKMERKKERNYFLHKMITFPRFHFFWLFNPAVCPHFDYFLPDCRFFFFSSGPSPKIVSVSMSFMHHPKLMMFQKEKISFHTPPLFRATLMQKLSKKTPSWNFFLFLARIKRIFCRF